MVIAVLPEPARNGHSVLVKTAPEGAVYGHVKNLLIYKSKWEITLYFKYELVASIISALNDLYPMIFDSSKS